MLANHTTSIEYLAYVIMILLGVIGVVASVFELGLSVYEVNICSGQRK